MRRFLGELEELDINVVYQEEHHLELLNTLCIQKEVKEDSLVHLTAIIHKITVLVRNKAKGFKDALIDDEEYFSNNYTVKNLNRLKLNIRAILLYLKNQIQRLKEKTRAANERRDGKQEFSKKVDARQTDIWVSLVEILIDIGSIIEDDEFIKHLIYICFKSIDKNPNPRTYIEKILLYCIKSKCANPEKLRSSFISFLEETETYINLKIEFCISFLTKLILSSNDKFVETAMTLFHKIVDISFSSTNKQIVVI